ncbi:hypothetical protein [Singulisphaera sp. PoT]|uniref:hypothetical protein n=1 Tax=Singulisphaera sp. PoT TaxID=3411797 RepID=UPI003BF57111
MSRLRIGFAALAAMILASASAEAQVVAPSPVRLNPYLAAPGYYGTTYGTASYGMKRTYTEFSSPYGAGYGYGYAPYALVPGKFGVGLWRPGLVGPGYVYGAARYDTFAIPGAPAPAPPLGVYAPAFGAPSPPTLAPPAYYSW